MISRDQEAVQAYLDDLLAEASPAEERGAPANRLHDVVSPASSPLAPALANAARSPAPVVSLQEQVQSLEMVKRQQLQALLDRTAPQEAPAIPRNPVAPPAEIRPLPEGKAPVLAPVPFVEPPAVSEPTSAPDRAAVTEPTSVSRSSPLLQWGENGRPVWAQKTFDVLLFRVAGLTLAVPLIALGQIYPLDERLTPIFGQAEWFMGLQPTPAGRIRTVNTALFVMPERYDATFVQSARYVVSIDGLDWGLAVDQVEQPTRLNPDDVTWRSERSKRPWLAGTVKAAMCALIDVPQMGRILESHDRKRAKTAR